MCRLAAFSLMSLDGFFEGPAGSLDWHRVDEEFREFAVTQLEAAGTLVFGKMTFEIMSAYWNGPGSTEDPRVARLMKELPKVVVSRTLSSVCWGNSRLERDLPAAKAAWSCAGKGEALIVGSAGLTASILARGWLSELRVMVVPVLLAEGRSYFRELEKRCPLELLKVRVFGNGNVLLKYRPSPWRSARQQ